MFENKYYQLNTEKGHAFSYNSNGNTILFDFPQFEIDGKCMGTFAEFSLVKNETLNSRISELSFDAEGEDGIRLTMVIRVSNFSPIVRFRYVLNSNKRVRLTKNTGRDNLKYLSYTSIPNAVQTEVRLSEYNFMYHAHVIKETTAFTDGNKIMGPILCESDGRISMLTAYEHGSQYPDDFICFNKSGDKVNISAVKGNYYKDQLIDSNNDYETIWLQCGCVLGSIDDLAREYRRFQLDYCTLNSESRKPYIFYNTWAFQERNKCYNNQEYLSSMNFDRIEKEIDIAHRMGIDVFVIDTGWYIKTGDWVVNEQRFPDHLGRIKLKLDSYGMKLGLWFNPVVAAKTSEMYKNNSDCVMNLRDTETKAFPIWETEESYPLCIVSKYWKNYAQKLCSLVEELGVCYFKWDAVGMYGCESGKHFHGTEESTKQECEECYAFNVVNYLGKVIDYVCAKHPEAIFDFDITEGGRCVGLSFLSSGKYFAINNGPYYENYDIEIEDDKWNNIFVKPGPARTWICRKILDYDKWIPSVLFLTHYLPDDGGNSQLINLASLILGQNGIWGDLLNISDEGIELFENVLSEYKLVCDDITKSSDIVLGNPGETFEVHEKINIETGRGAISLFANNSGKYIYKVKNNCCSNIKTFGPVIVSHLATETQIILECKSPTAAIAFIK